MKIRRVMGIFLNHCLLDLIYRCPDLPLFFSSLHGTLGHSKAKLLNEFLPPLELFGLSINRCNLFCYGGLTFLCVLCL